MADELTPRQREILSFVDGHNKREGYAPTMREIGAAVGINGAAALFQVQALERKGFLRRPAGPAGTHLARAIEVLKPVPLAPGDSVVVPKGARLFEAKTTRKKRIGEVTKYAAAGVVDADTELVFIGFAHDIAASERLALLQKPDFTVVAVEASIFTNAPRAA